MAGGDQRPSDSLVAAVIEAARSEVGKAYKIEIGEVVSYDADSQKAKVQPVIRRFFFEDGQPVAKRLPQLVEVPVVFPTFGGFVIVGPVQPGDLGLLFFTDRSIDDWKAQGQGDTTPGSRRRNNLADAVFQPGVAPFTAPRKQASATDLVIGEDGEDGQPLKQIRIGPGGVEITDGTNAFKLLSTGIEIGSAANDVLDILADFINHMGTSWLDTNGDGPGGSSVSVMTALKVKIDAIRTP